MATRLRMPDGSYIPATQINPQFVFGEQPGGEVNGMNATFETEYNFVPESVTVFVNGITQIKPEDFNTNGYRTILMAVSPEASDMLRVNYLRS